MSLKGDGEWREEQSQDEGRKERKDEVGERAKS